MTLKEVVKLPSVQFLDKLLHTSAYFVLTLSWLLAIIDKILLQKRTILVVFFVFIYGIIIEVLQGTLTTYRQADLYDMFANLAGVVIAWLFFTLFFSRKYRMK
ncbi:MAG: VanZ family protein [Lutibacter sp.]|nr:VanZ family protein [Lutibacter sp.]